jgi:hypothetical protein
MIFLCLQDIFRLTGYVIIVVALMRISQSAIAQAVNRQLPTGATPQVKTYGINIIF